jgi:hypothetical protein
MCRTIRDQGLSDMKEKMAEDTKLETHFQACHERWRKATLITCSRYSAGDNVSIY